jgi:hypothetical protein
MALWLEGSLEMVHTLAGMVSSAARQAEERTPDKEAHPLEDNSVWDEQP